MNIEQSSGQGDEKVMDIQIEKEMVAYFIMKNRKREHNGNLKVQESEMKGFLGLLMGLIQIQSCLSQFKIEIVKMY